MQWGVLTVCVGLFLRSCAQEAELKPDERHDGEQLIDWDSIIPKRTLENEPHPRVDLSDYGAFVSDQWTPVILPYSAASYRSRSANPELPEELFLNQPNGFPINFTEVLRSDTSNTDIPQTRDTFSPPLFYYQPQEEEQNKEISSQSSADELVPPPILEEVQNNLTASPSVPRISSVPNARLGERYRTLPYPYPNALVPDFLLRQNGGIRNSGNGFPNSPLSIPPAFYPPLSAEAEGLYPQVNIFVRPPYTDRERGSNIAPELQFASENVEPIGRVALPGTIPGPVRRAPPFARPAVRGDLPFEYLPPGLPTPFPLPPGAFQSRGPNRFLPNYPVPPNGFLPDVPNRILPNIPVPSNGFLPEVPSRILPNIPGPSNGFLSDVPNRILPNIPVPSENLIPEVPVVKPLSEPQEALPRMDINGAENQPRENTLTPDRTPYEFGYEMNDGKGTDQHRQESQNEAGVTTGSYGYRDPFGVYRLVRYIADKNGFRAFIKTNEPGVANPGSADVLVQAERPPEHTIAESLRQIKLTPVEIPDGPVVPEIKK